MSIIIKESYNGREIELPSSLSNMLITFGLESHMIREDVISILNQCLIRTVAKGDAAEYNRLNDALMEITEWTSVTVDIDL